MVDPADKERLEALEARLKAAKGAQEGPKPRSDEHYSQAQLAWRMVIELVAGVLIGFGIGYGLDALFGTRPVLMIIFLALGFAAGVRTMMRSAREVTERAEKRDGTGAAGDDERD